MEGADSVIREYKEAGLPNITGVFGGAEGSPSPSGAFSAGSGGRCPSTAFGDRNKITFNAKNGETKTDGTLKTEDEAHVYGSSDTVQPASYTVNYIIKATSGITTEAALDAFNMIKEYERKQNILSDIETITLTTTDIEMPYDGVISVSWRATNAGLADRQLLINGVIVGVETSTATGVVSSGSISYLVKQGDMVRINDTNFFYSATARWYKERDYGGR